MTDITTTLNAIRAHHPCTDGWKKLLAHLGKTEPDDEPLPLTTILDSNGLDDAFWALRAVEGYDREMRLFAVWCARQVQHLMSDQRSLDALDVAERHANGQATDEELAAAWDAASAAASAAAARAAARAAAWDAARDAAWAAARTAARAAAWAAARAAAWAAGAAAWAARAAAWAAGAAARAASAAAWAETDAARAASAAAWAVGAAQAAEFRRVFGGEA